MKKTKKKSFSKFEWEWWIFHIQIYRIYNCIFRLGSFYPAILAAIYINWWYAIIALVCSDIAFYRWDFMSQKGKYSVGTEMFLVQWKIIVRIAWEKK